ncbi:MAG: ABC transporter substrate-binding protein [Methanosarcinaceae archaeon]|jgi:peptide/nickel transport system substrate-binding protein|nr:ABC transporter substrate-binding protein [Methanosarcinaceae archaeon]
MKKRIQILCIVVAAVLGISLAFGEAIAVSKKRTLIIAQGADPTSLWPNDTLSSWELNPGSAITEAFMWRDPSTEEIKPLLAESWSWKDDTTFQLKLRKGVSFQNGEPFNADAAIFSLELISNKEIAPKYSRYTSTFKSFEKVDEYTINIHNKEPYPPILLTLYRSSVVPPKYWKEVGKKVFAQRPVGTGPFKFIEWKKDDRIVMDKNEKYWGELPKGIDRVIWKPVPDDMSRAAGLETGEYDLIANMSMNSALRLSKEPNVQLISGLSLRMHQVLLSSLEKHPGPLHDVRVRRAMNYAIDKESIINELFFGKAMALQGQLLREEQLGFNPKLKPFPYDPEKARKLLTEAGYPNGFEVEFKFPSGRYAQDREVAEALAGMLEKIGVKCKRIPLEAGEYVKQLLARECAPMCFTGLLGPDAHIMFFQYRSDWKYSYYQNPELDKLIDAGAVEIDEKKREKIYQKATQIMYDDCPVIFLYQGVDFYGATKRLKNWKPTGDQRIFLYGISLED